MPKFSVVIPVYNEEQSLLPLYSSLRQVMDSIKEPYEVIFINDDSSDRSLSVLRSFKHSENLIILNLERHSGQAVAMQAGFDAAKGETIITLDGDLQNDPQDIPFLLDKMREGYDLVCGWRHNREDPWHKLFASKIACTIRRSITKEGIHDFGCSLRVFKREILKNICLSGGMHRFFTLM